MNWMNILSYVFTFIIIPLVGIATIYLVGLIKAKSKEAQIKIDNDTLNKYIRMLEDTICNCVIATNQTYVEALKAQGKFDIDAQKIAFQRTYENIMIILSEDAKLYLAEAMGDLETYVRNKIETQVVLSKSIAK